MVLTPDEFDAAEFEEGHRYELIHGVLIVSPAPLPQERSPTDCLGYWLRSYQDNHPQGWSLDDTLPEHDVLVGDDRRRADRVIWAGLGRQPRVDETPTIVIEFVSAGRRNLARDYETKRREYLQIGVQEYWVFNRFSRTLTVFQPGGKKTVLGEDQVYTTPLLPGFELRLAELFEAANRWNAV
jgi:Uma2 family endonuclease